MWKGNFFIASKVQCFVTLLANPDKDEWNSGVWNVFDTPVGPVHTEKWGIIDGMDYHFVKMKNILNIDSQSVHDKEVRGRRPVN